jgi:hypothetical protein
MDRNRVRQPSERPVKEKGMIENENHVDLTRLEGPSDRAELRVEVERVFICWDVKAPGIENRFKMGAAASPRGLVALAVSVSVVAVIGGSIGAALWGLGMVTWAALAAGGLPYLMFAAMYAAEWHRAIRTADTAHRFLGPRRRRGGSAADNGDARH